MSVVKIKMSGQPWKLYMPAVQHQITRQKNLGCKQNKFIDELEFFVITNSATTLVSRSSFIVRSTVDVFCLVIPMQISIFRCLILANNRGGNNSPSIIIGFVDVAMLTDTFLHHENVYSVA